MQNKIFTALKDFLASLPINTNLIEIGPGRGDITKHLVGLNMPLLCLELDPASIEYLNQEPYIIQAKNFELRQSDALVQLETPSNPNLPLNFNLFSSLPYSTGSRMLVAMGLHYPTSSFGVIVQREVAQKSNLGDKKVTLFGIWLNLIWDTKLVFNIAPGNFYPAPKVTSSFLTGRAKPQLPEFLSSDIKRRHILNLLHQLVAQPNKTLANNLKAILGTSEVVNKFLLELGLDLKVRLKYDNYYQVIEQLTKKGY